MLYPKDKTDTKRRGLHNRLYKMQKKIRQGNKEKIASESERTQIQDRKSKQRNQVHKRQVYIAG